MLSKGVVMKWLGAVICLISMQAVADTALVDFDQGLVFPQELAGMACCKVEKYTNEDLGYSLFYKRDGGFGAEVSVFTFGRDSIPDSCKIADLDVVFQGVESWQKRQEGGGLIANVRKRGGTEVPRSGDTRFANVVFQYSEPRAEEGMTNSVPCILSVYATAAHNRFFKIQFNFDASENRAARTMAEQLVEQMVDTVKSKHSEDELLLAACDALVNDPSGYGGRSAAQRIWAKAQAMGDLNIYTHLFVWPDDYRKPKNADLLVAAYLAGMLKVVVPQKLDAGGEKEAFIAMLRAYENMRTRNDIESIPQLDEWTKHPDKRALFDELLYAPAEE
jgi:hypothetical protein